MKAGIIKQTFKLIKGKKKEKNKTNETNGKKKISEWEKVKRNFPKIKPLTLKQRAILQKHQYSFDDTFQRNFDDFDNYCERNTW